VLFQVSESSVENAFDSEKRLMSGFKTGSHSSFESLETHVHLGAEGIDLAPIYQYPDENRNRGYAYGQQYLRIRRHDLELLFLR